MNVFLQSCLSFSVEADPLGKSQRQEKSRDMNPSLGFTETEKHLTDKGIYQAQSDE